MTFKPIINETLNGVIWRMEIDAITSTLFAEVRNNEEKQVSFSAFDLNQGKILFKDLTTNERWLTGIEAAHSGILLLHYFQTETGPTHKGLLAIDGNTAETLWSNFSVAFDHLSADGLVVYDTRIQPRKYFLADVKTGATTRIAVPSVYNDIVNEIIAPEMIAPDALPFKLTDRQPYGNMVHYLEYNNLRIVSLHALKEGRLIQVLNVFDGTSLVYEDLLNKDIQKIQPEAFILHKNRLIYITDKSTLKVLSL